MVLWGGGVGCGENGSVWLEGRRIWSGGQNDGSWGRHNPTRTVLVTTGARIVVDVVCCVLVGLLWGDSRRFGLLVGGGRLFLFLERLRIVTPVLNRATINKVLGVGLVGAAR